MVDNQLMEHPQGSITNERFLVVIVSSNRSVTGPFFRGCEIGGSISSPDPDRAAIISKVGFGRIWVRFLASVGAALPTKDRHLCRAIVPLHAEPLSRNTYENDFKSTTGHDQARLIQTGRSQKCQSLEPARSLQLMSVRGSAGAVPPFPRADSLNKAICQRTARGPSSTRNRNWPSCAVAILV